MNIIIYLTMIPMLLLGAISYIYALITYINSASLNAVMLLIGLFCLFISIFILLLNLPKKIKNTKFILNLENRSSSLFSYISIIILFLFGLTLVLNCFINKFNIISLTLGVIIIFVFFYTTYLFCFEKSKVVFEVQNKEAVPGTKIYCVDLVNDEYGLIEYYTYDPSKLLRDKSYSFMYNKFTSRIITEVNEVIDIK